MATTTVTKKAVDLESAATFSDTDLFVVHDSQGLKKITGGDLKAALYEGNAGAHNSIYRGKNLGTEVTAEQYAAIAAGTFDDLYIGDYWTINGTKYVIAAFNYYKNVGDQSYSTNHVTLVPASTMGIVRYNETNSATGAYYGSELYTTGLETVREKIAGDFGDHLLSHKIILSNAINTSGVETGYVWATSTVDLMTEIMVYGCPIRSTVPKNYLCEKLQLPLFALNPQSVNARQTYWLRDVYNTAGFCCIFDNGIAGSVNASPTSGLRPAFSIF